MAAVSASKDQRGLANHNESRPNASAWNTSATAQSEDTELQFPDNHPHQAYNDALTTQFTKPNVKLQHTHSHISMHSTDNVLFPSVQTNASRSKNSSISDTLSATDSLLDLYGPNQSGMYSVDYQYESVFHGNKLQDDDDSENSRWIHRDKLAQIESQELQAAGIVLPRSRAPSKASSRRQQSKDLQTNNNSRIDSIQKRTWIDSLPTEEEVASENKSWDLRLPDEVAAEHGHPDSSSGVKCISRIPVCKKSPLPIPIAQLERDMIIPRKKNTIPTMKDEEVTTIKPREESDTPTKQDISTPPNPKRNISDNPTVKKSSTPTKSTSINQESSHRPNTRSGSNNNLTPTRTNENKSAPNKRPEGDPPWLSSMYKPDPRLPPDQQLLPTIAKRLQQEKWEKEGKFGNVYDTSFRPLNDQSPVSRPALQPIQAGMSEDPQNDEWPLQSPKSPNLSTGRPGTAGGYSTMPKIIEPPVNTNSKPSSKPLVKAPEPPEVKEEKRFKCCIIM
ncbi:hypothetical protein GcM3_023008 [Golovinomyces cichoracearum]|uniref:Uncharacterized protein n=1 Tax=Golovinomyces cichoracearum TaxID=62708 RepID=A0A420J704_9PEZI|nr:hypothetical protein GcM3_023008 [Golovinomyces cichoracearum]